MTLNDTIILVIGIVLIVLAAMQFETVIRVRKMQKEIEGQQEEVVRLADLVKDIAFENNKEVEER